MKQVATILAYNHDGKLLMGRRRDTGKWTNIGGHVDPHEDPHDAAVRELKEESDLAPSGGEMEYVGEDFVPGKKLTVMVFKCPVAGVPSGVNDPDKEIVEYAWFAPEEIPPDSQLHVPLDHNVLLHYFLPEGRLAKADSVIKSKTRYWKSKDGIKYAESGSAERKAQNKAHADTVAKYFAAGDKSRLKRVRIPIDLPTGSNMAVNKDRLKLYTSMARAGEPLPLAVVRRNGLGYDLLDGNHRQAAAKAAGHTHLEAFEIVEPKPKK